MSLFGIQKLPVIGKEQELLDAARLGNLATVVKLLTSKQDKGKKSTVGKLTSFLKSVNVNCTDKNGYTSLHHASVNGHRDIVEALLKAEAQPGLQDNQGCTPVHLAAWNGNAEIVMQLLNAGLETEYGSTSPQEPVHVNEQNGNGETALHCAAQYGHVAVVDVLLQKSANPTIRNLVDASPLDLAAQYGRREVVQRLLISHPELAHRPATTQSPLHLASGNGHREIVAVLLDSNFDLHTKMETGTALHEAALHGKLDVVKLLLQRGINVYERDSRGQTVLELLSAHQTQHKSFTDITQAIQEYMRQSEGFQDSGLYESLSTCRSGGDKPTAAVKPLPPEKSIQSDKPGPPSPALKPHLPDKTSQSEKPIPWDKDMPPGRLQVGGTSFRQSMSPNLGARSPGEKPVPFPRRSLIQLSPDQAPECSVIPVYTGVNKEKSAGKPVEGANKTVPDKGPPPLPPRTSVFAPENRTPAVPPATLTAAVTGQDSSIPEKSTKTMNIPKKPPRQKKSPVPVRRAETPAKVNNSTHSPTPPTSSPSIDTQSQCKQVTSCDSAETESSSQHSTVHCHVSDCNTGGSDVTDCADSKSGQSGCSDSKSSQSGPPVKSPKPVLPPRKFPPKVDNSVDPVTGQQVNQSFYVEMKANKSKEQVKPVSEVKPQISERKTILTPPSQPKVDNYGILFPNLKKEVTGNTNKYDLQRSNTSPEEEHYVAPGPNSPTAKFKEKQGLLRRTNTAPEESAYMSMTNLKRDDKQKDEIDPKDENRKENEYSEIPEKSPRPASPTLPVSPGSPKENIYATIPESKQEVDTGVYSQIKDLTPPVSPNVKSDDSTVDAKDDNDTKGLNKPNYLEFVKRKSTVPLTPTGYTQPPTPDFPPPSPTTAMMGIELKIQQIDSKRKSKDITTITDDSSEENQEQQQQQQQEDSSEVTVTPTGTYKVKVTGQRSSEVKVTQSESSVKLVETGIKSVEEANEATDTNLSQSEDTENVKVDKVDTSSDKSVIPAVDNKNIPESSIPEISVFETEETVSEESDTMLQSIKNRFGSSKNKQGQTGNDKSAEKQSKDGKKSETQSSDGEKAECNTDDAKNTLSGGSPVVMRRKSSSTNPDMDVFKGLLRGSTIGVPRKATSQFYDEVLRKNNARSRDIKTVYMTGKVAPPHMDKEEDIDVDLVMKSIDVEVARRASGHDSTAFDDAEEWEKIADIMSSFGGNLTSFESPTHSPSEEEFNHAFEAYMDRLLSNRETGSITTLVYLHPTCKGHIQDIMASFGSSIARESVFVKDFEPKFVQMLAGQGQMVSVGEWLESIDMAQYENSFVANGFDNIDYLDSKVLEEQDLEQIGVLAHDHRQKILHSTRLLPQLKPIDTDNPPSSVEEWLASLQLLDYLETFRSHGYDTIDKVQSILWELQLRTVLDISMLGHRKRILASLGERKPLERQNSQTQKTIGPPSPEKAKSPLDINLFKDYTNVKPVSSSEEDIKESTQMAVDSSEDEDVFKKTSSGQSIRNSNIHIRPPHLAQTSSPARQWRHKPEMLIKGCCNYTAQYLGSTVVPELTGGTECTKTGITKLKKSADVLAKIPIIMLSISFKGVKFIDAKSKKVICDHEIGNIFCACQDTEHLNFFAYITRDIETGQHYCHVFSVKSPSLAHDIILTLGESFEVAFQMAMKEKSVEEAMELDRKTSQSDVEDTQSITSKISTNTV